MSGAKVAVITGANRGIGRATALRFADAGYHVVIGARDAAQAEEVREAIAAKGGTAEAMPLDVTAPASIDAAADALAKAHSSISVLINNAGINVGQEHDIIAASYEDIEASLAINALGPLRISRALLPLLEASKDGASIINVSSEAGSIAATLDPENDYALMKAGSYRLSKMVLNGVTALLSKALKDTSVTVHAMCPGWTQTDIGGPDAPNTPEDAADLALGIATGGVDAPDGSFRNREGALPW